MRTMRKRIILIVLFIGVVVVLACVFEAQLQKFGGNCSRALVVTEFFLSQVGT